MIDPMYEYRAIVKRWIDGDTVVVDWDLGRRVWVHDEHLRMFGYNAADKDKVKKAAATAFMVEKAPPGTEVLLVTIEDKEEKYGRYLADLYIGDEYLNRAILNAGLALPWNGKGVKPE